jgi:hypothetical protein
VSWTHVLESALGTAAALLIVVGGRQLASRAAYRALRAAMELRRRTGR